MKTQHGARCTLPLHVNQINCYHSGTAAKLQSRLVHVTLAMIFCQEQSGWTGNSMSHKTQNRQSPNICTFAVQGDHKLTLQFANANHESYGPEYAKTITVTVK
eukprot:1157096-Pelagomonas_calceolata.AAC.8